MTDKKDDYYQPWLRDPAPESEPLAKPMPDEARARARRSAAPGIDMDHRAPSPLPTHDAPPSRERMKAGAQGTWQAIRRAAESFADWTVAIGERADIPARVEAMEIPRRAHALAKRSGALAARTARAVGSGSARAGRAAAQASGEAWEKMALGDKVGRLSNEAGRGLGEVAHKTKAGLSQAARAGKDGIGEAATKLRPARAADLPPPASGLEQLLAREENAAAAGDAAPTPDLPLFAGEAIAAAAPDTPPLAEADDRSPHVAPVARAKAPARRGAMAAGPVAGAEERIMMPPSTRTRLIGGIAAAALIGTSFWLGGRFGGGMSKGDVETIVADYIKANPQIIPQALEAQRDREIAKAIDAVRPALEKPYAGAWAGHADGDVTLVVFTDYACGFCRASLPDIDRLLREDKRLKVVFRELPIISPRSRDAALMALAAARQGKYDAFHHAMFAASSLEPAAIAAAADKAGVVTDGSADATANEALFQRELDANLAIATQLQLNATPTWIVGEQMLQGQLGYDALRRAIARARSKA